MSSEEYCTCFAHIKGVRDNAWGWATCLQHSRHATWRQGSAPAASGASAPGAAGVRAAMVEMAASWSSTSQALPSGAAATARQLSRRRMAAAGHAHQFQQTEWSALSSKMKSAPARRRHPVRPPRRGSCRAGGWPLQDARARGSYIVDGTVAERQI